MSDQATKLETAESNLRQLMADVSRAMEKAQEAIARVTSTVGAATAGTESATKSRWNEACALQNSSATMSEMDQPRRSSHVRGMSASPHLQPYCCGAAKRRFGPH